MAEKGCEILYFTEDVDEFAIQILREFEGKEFKSVSAGDLDIETEEEKKENEKKKEENKDLFLFLKDALGEKVKEVRASSRLKSHPVCLTTDGALSLDNHVAAAFFTFLLQLFRRLRRRGRRWKDHHRHLPDRTPPRTGCCNQGL